jgi:alkyl hydroperoxide reductase subunit AhpF
LKENSFTPVEEKQLIKLNHQLSQDMTIGLVASRHTSSKLFDEFCDALIRLVPKIKISKVEDDPQDPPQILIGSGLRYQAVPTGHELQPFLEALAAFESDSLKMIFSGFSVTRLRFASEAKITVWIKWIPFRKIA